MQRALPARSARGVLKEGRHDARRIAQEAEVLGLVEREPGAKNKQASKTLRQRGVTTACRTW